MPEYNQNPYLTNNPYRLHLNSGSDLVTTYEETRAGFVAQALEKTRIAVPFVEEARSLKATAQQVRAARELLNLPQIRSALETAAGISDKSGNHITTEMKNDAILGLIENYLEPAGPNFVDELVFRFLLIKGDSLGGSIRNIISQWAEAKLSRAIISSLNNAGIGYHWLPKGRPGKWLDNTDNNVDIERLLKGISWENNGRTRTLMYNLTVPFLEGEGKNVDMCVFNCSFEDYHDKASNGVEATKNIPQSYVALGELKGGIDPAGSDEHWKTARSALVRIQRAFSSRDLTPNLFFVGAAIEKSVSEDIWTHLENGTIKNAANLTKPNQLSSLCNWLCNI